MVVKVPYRNIENSIEKVKIVKEENLELVGENNWQILESVVYY